MNISDSFVIICERFSGGMNPTPFIIITRVEFTSVHGGILVMILLSFVCVFSALTGTPINITNNFVDSRFFEIKLMFVLILNLDAK